MRHMFNPQAVVVRDTAAQRARFAEMARTERMLASDLGISPMRIRFLRWAGCAPSAVLFEGTVYYRFDDIAEWRRRFE